VHQFGYLTRAADVFRAASLVEAKISAQTLAKVVTINAGNRNVVG
jgi:hypothetical protein